MTMILKMYKNTGQRPVKRYGIQKTLSIIGIPKERIYVKVTRAGWREPEKNCRVDGFRRWQSFWERHPEDLEEIAEDAKRIFREHLRQIKHDFIENHETAQLLIGAYEQFKKLYREHGMEV